MILHETYQNFSKVADNIPNWRLMSKNDLLNLYIDHENDINMKEYYISAIFCRYWGAISKYYATSRGSVSVEDCFEWLSHAILYALEHRKWKDPTSSLYGDPAGPDKAVNICISSTRNIFYQSSNNDNRKINFGLESIQRLQDEDLSCLLPADDSFDSDYSNTLFYRDIVSERFKKDRDIQGLIIDGIMNGDVFDKESKSDPLKFSKKKLVKHLRNINGACIKYISNTYNVGEKKVSTACQEVKKMLSPKLYKLIDCTLVSLSKTLEQTYEL